MTDYPIQFSAPMVSAIKAGRKTQTRRKLYRLTKNYATACFDQRHRPPLLDMKNPDHMPGETWTLSRWASVKVGDRLWVREAWRPSYSAEGWREDLGRVARPIDFDPKTTSIEYLADGEHELNGKNRPAMFMPRWASRFTLTVTAVRVQQLQEIDDAAAVAEGMFQTGAAKLWASSTDGQCFETPRAAYMALWGALHGPMDWSSNPWVTATSFSVEMRNIDGLAAEAA